MTDFPRSEQLPLFINSFSRYTPVTEYAGVIGPVTAALTWVANQALYIPFSLPWPYPVRRVFWSNGTSVTSTNRDFGIYTADGTRIYNTTSTAASGVSVLQYTTPSPDFVLAPGRYYMGITCNTATAARGGTGMASLNIARLAMAGYLEEASALPLPATMTPVTVALTSVPLCGFTRTSSGF